MIGVPSERYGEEVMAWVKPKPGASLSDADLDAVCLERIVMIQDAAPRKIDEEFPPTMTGQDREIPDAGVSTEELGLGAARDPSAPRADGEQCPASLDDPLSRPDGERAGAVLHDDLGDLGAT